jgi:diguanylate cyclase (GGDEF)-like protein
MPLPFRKVRSNVLIGSTALIAVLMLAIVLIPQALSRHARLQVLRGHVGEVARVAASVVDGDLHRRLIETRDVTAAEHAAALAPLLNLHRAWPEAKYLYTMGVRDGQAFFVLDTAQDAAFAKLRGLRASQYLEPFRLRSEYASNWLDELAAGRTFVNPQFQSDDYGYFLTGHAPIRDAAGRIAGFVGVDFDLDYAVAEEARFLQIEWASVGSALLLSLLLGYFYARYDFDQHAELQRHLESSMNDSLTGLLNRRGADAAILAATSGRGAADVQRSHAALLVDIDHFKSINDTHGHAKGDAVITRLANALRAGLRPGDVAARLGGDEFLIFVPDCDLARAEHIAGRLLDKVREEARSDGAPFEVSVGVAVAKAAEGDFDVLYHRADLALYQAKNAGKNRYAVYRA